MTQNTHKSKKFKTFQISKISKNSKFQKVKNYPKNIPKPNKKCGRKTVIRIEKKLRMIFSKFSTTQKSPQKRKNLKKNT